MDREIYMYFKRRVLLGSAICLLATLTACGSGSPDIVSDEQTISSAKQTIILDDRTSGAADLEFSGSGSNASGRFQSFNFEVKAGETIDVQVTWENPDDDVRLFLRDETRTQVDRDRNGNGIATASAVAETTGQWSVAVLTNSNTVIDYKVLINASVDNAPAPTLASGLSADFEFSSSGSNASGRFQIFKFEVEAGETVNAQVIWENSGDDVRLFLRDETRTQVDRDRNGSGIAVTSVVAETSGQWSVAVLTNSDTVVDYDVLVNTSGDNAPTPEPLLAAAIEPEPEVFAEPLASKNVVIVGGNPGDAQCLNFGTEDIGFGSVKDTHWQQWVPDFRYVKGEEFLSVEKDADGSSVLRHKYVPSSRGTERVLTGSRLPQHRTYRLTESVFFEPDWDWGGDFEGGKLGFGFGGGTTPTGGIIDPAGFTARVMWRGNKDGTSRLSIYSYAADRPGQYGEDIFLGNYLVPIGEWVQITYEVTTNSSINKSDGRVRAWVNGEQLLDRGGIGWQLAGDKPFIDSFSYSSFYGGATERWSPSKTTFVKLKDVCWAPVVNGYSGINPDDGLLHVAPVSSTSNVFTAKSSSGKTPEWAQLQGEVGRLVEEAKTLLQITTSSANIAAQLHYTNAVADANSSLTTVRQVSAISLGLNPVAGVAGALEDLDQALSLNTVEQHEIEDSITVKNRLETALLTTVDLAIAVVENSLSASGCDSSSNSLNCFESIVLMEEAKDLQTLAKAAAKDSWQDTARLAEEAWNRSTTAINLLN